MLRQSTLALSLMLPLSLAGACSSSSNAGNHDAAVDGPPRGSLDGAPDTAVLADGAALPDGVVLPDGEVLPDGDGGPLNPPNPSGLGPRAVDLGSAANHAAPGSYALLAKTGITNVTGSSITGGDVGLSPAAASFITGFSLIADATNVFSMSASVVAPAKVYASDYATPTPSNLTTAIVAMQTAYTDAATRTLPDFLNLGSGNLGGKTLVPGLYTWGTGVTIPTDVTLAGGANDVWIFQISNDLDLSSATHVLLSGGASAANVFWQVAGQVTIHANAHFEGVVLCKTAITLQTLASLHGRALAQTLIALDNDAVTAP
jgi:hypothetical protein